jgi:hypothetical protein
MSPHTFQIRPSIVSVQRSLVRLGALVSTVLGLGISPTGAIATPALVSQVATPPNGTGDIIIDSGSAGNRFSCQTSNGQYMVMYQPESQPGKFYPWALPSTMGGGWDSARRCNEITRRLEAYRPDGLQEMQTGLENGYNTICVTTQRIPSCRIVLTVPPGQDAITTRDRVFQNLTIADSGQQTQGVNTFAANNRGGILTEVGRWLNIGALGTNRSSNSDSNNINLRPFLDQADGGTGQFLRNRAVTPGRQLNPNNFR